MPPKNVAEYSYTARAGPVGVLNTGPKHRGSKRAPIGAKPGRFESEFRGRPYRTKTADSHVRESIRQAAILPGRPIKYTVDIEKMRPCMLGGRGVVFVHMTHAQVSPHNIVRLRVPSPHAVPTSP